MESANKQDVCWAAAEAVNRFLAGFTNDLAGSDGSESLRKSQSLARFGCSGGSSGQKSSVSDRLSVGYMIAHGGFGKDPDGNVSSQVHPCNGSRHCKKPCFQKRTWKNKLWMLLLQTDKAQLMLDFLGEKETQPQGWQVGYFYQHCILTTDG